MRQISPPVLGSIRIAPPIITGLAVTLMDLNTPPVLPRAAASAIICLVIVWVSRSVFFSLSRSSRLAACSVLRTAAIVLITRVECVLGSREWPADPSWLSSSVLASLRSESLTPSFISFDSRAAFQRSMISSGTAA